MCIFILISYLGLLNIWLKASLENMFKKVKLIKSTFAFINQQQRALFPKFIYFDDALWQRSTYWIIFIEWTSLDFWGSRLQIWDQGEVLERKVISDIIWHLVPTTNGFHGLQTSLILSTKGRSGDGWKVSRTWKFLAKLESYEI